MVTLGIFPWADDTIKGPLIGAELSSDKGAPVGVGVVVLALSSSSSCSAASGIGVARE